MTLKKGYTADDLIAAIRDAKGNVSNAAKLLDPPCSRKTFYVYLKKFKTAQDALEETREKRTDYVEDKLMDAISEGNVTAIIFYLKTQAKDRGYIERQEIAIERIDEAIDRELARVAGRSED